MGDWRSLSVSGPVSKVLGVVVHRRAFLSVCSGSSTLGALAFLSVCGAQPTFNAMVRLS